MWWYAFQFSSRIRLIFQKNSFSYPVLMLLLIFFSSSFPFCAFIICFHNIEMCVYIFVQKIQFAKILIKWWCVVRVMGTMSFNKIFFIFFYYLILISWSFPLQICFYKNPLIWKALGIAWKIGIKKIFQCSIYFSSRSLAYLPFLPACVLFKSHVVKLEYKKKTNYFKSSMKSIDCSKHAPHQTFVFVIIEHEVDTFSRYFFFIQRMKK